MDLPRSGSPVVSAVVHLDACTRSGTFRHADTARTTCAAMSGAASASRDKSHASIPPFEGEPGLHQIQGDPELLDDLEGLQVLRHTE